MVVLLDDGIYRHLRFKEPASGAYWFDIVTYPNHIVIGGDMGAFVMTRLHDMFNFIRTDDNDFNKNKNGLSINPRYWGEKIVSGADGIKEFSINKFKEVVTYCIDSKLEGEGWSESEIHELKSEVLNEIDYCDDNEVRLFDLINEYEYNGDETEDGESRNFTFTDFWEYMNSTTVWTFHYIWKCYALAYAVQEYDKFKQGEVK